MQVHTEDELKSQNGNSGFTRTCRAIGVNLEGGLQLGCGETGLLAACNEPTPSQRNAPASMGNPKGHQVFSCERAGRTIVGQVSLVLEGSVRSVLRRSGTFGSLEIITAMYTSVSRAAAIPAAIIITHAGTGRFIRSIGLIIIKSAIGPASFLICVLPLFDPCLHSSGNPLPQR